MTIREVKENKKQHLDLLLLADEQEDMIDRYLEDGTLYALDDGGVQAICVVTDEGDVFKARVTPEKDRRQPADRPLL